MGSNAKSVTEVGVVSVLMDLGAGRRGVDMGPSAVRIAELGGELERIGVGVRETGTVHASEPERIREGAPKTRYLSEIQSVCQETRRLVGVALDRGLVPLILGGDHALSIGSVSGVADHYAKRGERVGLIWVDAHTDMNTPDTTPSGNIHGMALAVLLGEGPESLTRLGETCPVLAPENVSILGVREVDPEERPLVKRSGVRVFTMSEVDERGIGPCMEEALARAGANTAGFHLSFDLDGIDPMEAPGVGTPIAGGLTYREAHLICEMVFRSRNLLSMEVVELNPVLDLGNQTARLAVELIASALGKTIL